RRHRLGGPPPRINHHRLIDAPSFTPSEYVEIFSDFRRRLQAIVNYCERIGALAILVIDPANESGYEPNRSVLPERVSAADREDISERFLRARALERQEPLESMTQYRSILLQVPEFAEAHFRLGRLLEQDSSYDEAREHYTRARDLDGFPVRLP